MTGPTVNALHRALHLVYVADLEAAQDRDRLHALVRGGVTAIWLREPSATGADLYDAACSLRASTRDQGVALVIGDRMDVALAVGADGIQLGHRAPPISRLRTHYPGWIGVSCHSADDLARAAASGADHVVLRPVFDVPGKGAPQGVPGFERLGRSARLPEVALGGIGADSADAVRNAGAVGVAALRALARAPDPEAAARALSGDGRSG